MKHKKTKNIPKTSRKSEKFRIYPTQEQKRFFDECFGANRWIYNWGLDLLKSGKQIDGSRFTIYDLLMYLPDLKSSEIFNWLNNIPSQSIQASIEKLEGAMNRFFKKQSKFPKFKSKHNTKQSFQIKQGIEIIWENNRVKIPKLKSLLKIELHRNICKDKPIKCGTILKSPSGKYYLSISYDTFTPSPRKKEIKKSIGIDVGIKTLLTTFDGKSFSEINNLKLTKKYENKLALKQRSLENKKRGSNNRVKVKLKVAKIHEKISNIRRDYLHKLSRNLVREYDLICVEDLDVQKMQQSKVGSQIGDCGWGMFFQILKYKCEESGKHFLKVDKFYPSSKTCNHCGFVNKDLKLSERVWECPNCKLSLKRDENAAKNILAFGLDKISKSVVESKELSKDFQVRPVRPEFKPVPLNKLAQETSMFASR